MLVFLFLTLPPGKANNISANEIMSPNWREKNMKFDAVAVLMLARLCRSTSQLNQLNHC